MPAMRTKKKTFRATQAPQRSAFVAITTAALLASGGVATLAHAAPKPAGPSFYAAAADARPPQLRSVEGRVLDKTDTPINGAVVYLKDTRTLSVKSYLTDDAGRFHFGQLSDGADYEVWAEQSGKRSSSKSISQFNNKLDIQFTLKIDRDK